MTGEPYEWSFGLPLELEQLIQVPLCIEEDRAQRLFLGLSCRVTAVPMPKPEVEDMPQQRLEVFRDWDTLLPIVRGPGSLILMLIHVAPEPLDY